MNSVRISRDSNQKLIEYMASGKTGSDALNADLESTIQEITHMRSPYRETDAPQSPNIATHIVFPCDV